MMKMKPVKATIETIMTIFGPYLSAAHPLNYLGQLHHIKLRTDGTHQETEDTSSRTTVTEPRLPGGWNGITDFSGIRWYTKSSQEVR